MADSNLNNSQNIHKHDFGPEPSDEKIDKIKSDMKQKIQELLHILDGQNIRIQKLLDKLSEIKKQIEELEDEIKKSEDEITALNSSNENEQTEDITPLIQAAKRK